MALTEKLGMTQPYPFTSLFAFSLFRAFASKCRTRYRIKKAGALALLPLLAGCQSSFPQSLSASSAAASVQFSDVTDAAGIRFVHRNGAVGKKWMPETTGSGCAFLDTDNDGWEDILLVNSGSFSGVQAFRGSGVRAFRRSGVQAFRGTGTTP